ncbi:MAG: glycosyltransferase [Termitinemataceae bacterium]|nr:MAG: glycosyltransferase [Termitinemataceae bacterium]
MINKKVSIVVPALNEKITIAEFITWCKEGLEKANVDGEIIIIDSSTDETPQIAKSMGARVLSVPKKGLGQAYIDALPEIKGDYVIMGDCDCTYDFREIGKFVDKLEEGYEFVMGTRMKGYIEPGAMPPLHRYFGTPLTTKLLNAIYGSHFSDIHCGMRAMTREALNKISLESTSWEYASEMVLKAAKLKLKTAEVPIRFYKDKEGRLSQHKRTGWFSPWLAGWINLRVMLVYNPQFFLRIPGIVLMFLGIAFVGMSLLGRFVEIFNMFSLHTLMVAFMSFIFGFSSYQLSVFSEVYYAFDKDKVTRYRKKYTYNKLMGLAGIFFIAGTAFLLWFLNYFIKGGFVFGGIAFSMLFAVVSFVISFQIFTFSLLFEILFKKRRMVF